MPSVLISGFYGFDNTGDEAILFSIVKELKSSVKDIEIVVLSANPDKTVKQFNVKAVNRNNMKQIFTALKNCDILLSGGGSLMQDATSFFSMWYYSSIIVMAFMLKKPVFVFAQGIGPVKNKLNRKLLKSIMNRVNNVSVRDLRSLRELESIGVSRKIVHTSDPAFLIKNCSDLKSIDILKKEFGSPEIKGPFIGFSIRRWKGSTKIANIIAEVADQVMSELGAEVVFFPLQRESDLILAKEIASKMKTKPLIIQNYYKAEDFVGLYGCMDLNVSIRYHGLVFSIINGVPAVPISYDPKIDSLMEWLGDKVVLKYEDLNKDKIYREILEKWDKRQRIAEELQEKKNDFINLSAKGFEEIIQYINNF